jgi:hypothetical protein
MAGAMMVGPSYVSQRLPRRLSAIPQDNLLMVFAVAGAIINRFASFEKFI